MHPADRARALARALALIDPALASGHPASRHLRWAILAVWPADVPLLSHRELVDGIRSIRRADATARVGAAVHQPSDIGGSS